MPCMSRILERAELNGEGAIYGKHGRCVRLVYLAVASLWWLCSGMGRLGTGNVVVLCYHAITRQQKERFRWQMSQIAPRAVSVDALMPVSPKSRWRKRNVCITFDDAFECLLDNALPITRELGIPTIIFGVSGNLGMPPSWKMAIGRGDVELRTMTAKQIRSVASFAPCRVGSHTVTHRRLADLSMDVMTTELAESKEMLESIVCESVEDIAVPYGSYNNTVLAEARVSGYQLVYTLEECCHPGALPDGAVGRFSVSADMWHLEYLLTTAGAYAWLHPWRKFWRWLLGNPGVTASVGS